jgi:hypothetical protein
MIWAIIQAADELSGRRAAARMKWSAFSVKAEWARAYRARDTQLDRDVAFKVLPEAFASQPDRLMRFERNERSLRHSAFRAAVLEPSP